VKIETGILGLGSKSTLFYIEELNRIYNKTHGAYSTFPFKLLNTNFDEINQLLPHYSEELDRIVTNYLEQLISLKVSSVLIPNITLHETIDKIMKREKYPISLVHPLKETTSRLKNNQIKEVVLFGTFYTMNSAYINTHFNENEILITKPSQKDMELIDKIRKEVYDGIQLPENAMKLKSLIEKYSKEKKIIISCTELSMINHDSDQSTYDMSKIQLQETISRASI